MQEKLSGDADLQLKESDILSEWLGEARFSARILIDIDDALSILATKRTTLEEKIIGKELHTLASKLCLVLDRVHTQLAAAEAPRQDALEKWRTLNFQSHEVIEMLLKALRYNLNYVEQYFEFNFSSRLVNEWQLSAEAQALLDVLKD